MAVEWERQKKREREGVRDNETQLEVQKCGACDAEMTRERVRDGGNNERLGGEADRNNP